MQYEYCQQCRQPLEEWEAGLCEGCGSMKQQTGKRTMTTKIAIRQRVVRKCEDVRRSIDAVRREPEHPEHSIVLADLTRVAEMWRRELDRVY